MVLSFVHQDMSVIATVAVPAESFAFGRVLRERSGLTVRLDRVVPLGETVIPYIWVSDGSGEAIERVIEADPTVAAVTVIEAVDSEVLLRIEWANGTDALIDTIAASEAGVLSAVGSGEEWTMKLRFPDHDGLAAFHDRCLDRDIEVRLRRIHNPSVPTDLGFRFSLTPLQRETLLTAVKEGYFTVPRETNLAELAEKLGISDTATSQRLRRGMAALIAATLIERHSDEEQTTER